MASVLKEYSLYIAVLLGMLSGIPVIWSRRERLAINNRWKAVLMACFYSVIGLGSTMAFAKFEGLIMGTSGGNVSLYGMIFFAGLLLLITGMVKKDKSRALFDLYTLYAILSLFWVRSNCIFSGCCQGRVISGTDFRWPTRETELIFYVIVFVLLWRESQNETRAGQLFPKFMILYGCFRFVNEWFRVNEAIGVGFHLSHVWSVLCVVIGASIYFEMRAKEAKSGARNMRR